MCLTRRDDSAIVHVTIVKLKYISQYNFDDVLLVLTYLSCR